ncbi:MAG: imidazole glycerol phosphate synthase subunit HisF [Acidimicrobiia bacterium]
MLAPRLIACLDVKDGRVVKGVRFSSLRDSGDPVETARRYEQDNADEIVILDVSATPEGRANAVSTVQSVRQVLSIPLTVGGGIRSLSDAQAVLEAGADRVAVNSAAVANPELITEIAARFGSQCAVVSIDAARRSAGWEVLTNSGSVRTGIDVINWAQTCEERGAGEILLTSWDRDGTNSGYDDALIAAVRAAVAIPIVASGGAGTANDLVLALGAGSDAVLVASILHDGVTTIPELKRELVNAGIGVRA